MRAEDALLRGGLSPTGARVTGTRLTLAAIRCSIRLRPRQRTFTKASIDVAQGPSSADRVAFHRTNCGHTELGHKERRRK